MCMMKLATNTMTADSTMGIHKAVRGTMRSLPGMKFWMPCNVEYRDFPREATLDQGSSQEPGGKHPRSSSSHLVTSPAATAPGIRRSHDVARRQERASKVLARLRYFPHPGIAVSSRLWT